MSEDYTPPPPEPQPPVEEQVKKAKKDAYIMSAFLAGIALMFLWFWYEGDIDKQGMERYHAWERGYDQATANYEQQIYCLAQPTRRQQEECIEAWGEAIMARGEAQDYYYSQFER